MTTFNARIQDAAGNDPVYGDDVEVRRTVTGIAQGDSLSKGWLTVKSGRSLADVDAELQLVITTTANADGEIETAGGGETDGVVRFDIAGSDYDDLTAGTDYHYDIQVRTTNGIVKTLESGRVNWAPEVTQATS